MRSDENERPFAKLKRFAEHRYAAWQAAEAAAAARVTQAIDDVQRDAFAARQSAIGSRRREHDVMSRLLGRAYSRLLAQGRPVDLDNLIATLHEFDEDGVLVTAPAAKDLYDTPLPQNYFFRGELWFRAFSGANPRSVTRNQLRTRLHALRRRFLTG